MKEYKAQGRYNYIGIDLYENDKCLKTVITGIKPLKLGRRFAELLQEAYEQGREDEKQKHIDFKRAKYNY